jgi:hypothetical protein
MKVALFGLLGVLALVVPPAFAQDAPPPPIGTWQGTTSNGKTVTLSIAANGEVLGQAGDGQPIHGRAQWDPTTGGGFLTIRLDGRRRNESLFYSVTYVDANTINLAQASYWVVLRRQ